MRILTYSHDSCGLGHLRRTFLIGRHLADFVPGSTVLSVIGSTLAEHYFKPWGENHDYLKLPSLTKVGPDRYESRYLSIGFDDMIDLRRSLLSQTLKSFLPDLVIVDKNPRGLGGEIESALEGLREAHPSSRIVLGLRDVLDDPETVRPYWSDPREVAWIEKIYDAIWIWGESEIYDAVEAYGFPDGIRAMTKYMGYLAPQLHREDVSELRLEAGVNSPGERLLLLAAGGGGDGFEMFSHAIRGINQVDIPTIRTMMIAGPLMPERQYRELCGLVEGSSRVTLRRMVDHFEDWIRASDAVVCMGGYNTLREVAALGKTALVIPRRYPRREQLIRASIFSSMGWCELPAEGESVDQSVAGYCRRLAEGELAPSLTTLPCRGLKALLDEVEHGFPARPDESGSDPHRSIDRGVRACESDTS